MSNLNLISIGNIYNYDNSNYFNIISGGDNYNYDNIYII